MWLSQDEMHDLIEYLRSSELHMDEGFRPLIEKIVTGWIEKDVPDGMYIFDANIKSAAIGYAEYLQVSKRAHDLLENRVHRADCKGIKWETVCVGCKDAAKKMK